jgi:hypothetical protein
MFGAELVDQNKTLILCTMQFLEPSGVQDN